jgi:hypothetical protein
VHRQVILALLGDRAVVDVLVAVIARIGRGVAAAPERDVQPVRRKNGAVDEVGIASVQVLFQL